VGFTKAPPVSASDFLYDLNSAQNSSQNGILLVFKISPIVGLEVTWETTLFNNSLYLDLPNGILPEGSKESLVTLLEFAEEELCCRHVILCFRKDRNDRVSLLRVFNFFGFQILTPNHPLIMKPNKEIMHMAYAIEQDSSDDDGDGDSSGSESDGIHHGRESWDNTSAITRLSAGIDSMSTASEG